MSELTVRFGVAGERAILRLSGELDLDGVPELRLHARAELAAGRCRILTVDMSGLTFIDSTGLGLLVELRRLADASGITLELADVPPRIRRVIALGGLAETFGLSSDSTSVQD